MEVLAAYAFGVLLENIIQFILAFVAGFNLRSRGTVFWIVTGVLTLILIGMSMNPGPNQQRLNETFVVSALGAAIGVVIDLVRRFRTENLDTTETAASPYGSDEKTGWSEQGGGWEARANWLKQMAVPTLCLAIGAICGFWAERTHLFGHPSYSDCIISEVNAAGNNATLLAEIIKQKCNDQAAMPVVVRGPDGQTFSFPADATREEIFDSLRSFYPTDPQLKAWNDQQATGAATLDAAQGSPVP